MRNTVASIVERRARGILVDEDCILRISKAVLGKLLFQRNLFKITCYYHEKVFLLVTKTQT